MTSVPSEEIRFHPASFCDRNGRVFFWRGELYRALTADGAALCRRMFAEGIIDRLVGAKLLVETEMTELAIDGFEAVVKHRRLPFVSLANEWSPRMVRDAGLLVANLELALRREGLGLDDNDADLGNVLFDGCQPIYVDLGSIVDAGSLGDRRYREFETRCLFPAQLFATGQAKLGRALLQPQNDAALAELAAAAFDPRQRQSLSVSLRRILAPLLPMASVANAPSDRIAQLKAVLEQQTMPPMAEAEQSGDPSEGAVSALLKQLGPKTAMAIGRDAARFLPLLVAAGCQTVFVDLDDRVVDREYSSLCEQSDSVLPLVLDLRYPTPGFGVCNREVPPASERLACDLVLAADIAKPLVFERYLNLDQVASGLALFSKRWLAIDYRTPAPNQIDHWQKRFPWYTAENLLAALRGVFRSVTKYHEQGPGRLTFLCEK